MKKLIFVSFIILFLASNDLKSQIQNFRIHPSLNAQIEPAIVKHPLNPLIMFVASYTISNSFRSEGVYFTTNGGLDWFGSDTCNSGGSTNNHGGDPGPIIDKDGRNILTHQGGFIVGMFSNTSTNLGATWSNNILIASGDQDKGTPGTDDVSTSAYYGRTYIVWTRFISPFPIVSSFTTNGGSSWSSINQVNVTPSGFVSLGGDIKVNKDGDVCVCWAGVLLNSPQNEKFCGFAKSSNGGVSWIVNENIYAMNGVKTASLQPWNIRINGYPHIETDKTGGDRNGWIYIVTGEKNLSPAGTDPDVVFHRSNDGGNTWSAGVRVNQDPINNGKVQYFPAINVDDNGGLNVIYYDNRKISSDSMDVYLSRSTDGGSSWRDYRINDHRFRPKTVTGAVGAGNQGDNIGITSVGNKLWPVWMDDHTGVYQIWAAPIDLNTIGITQTISAIPETFTLMQNYPNPFNPVTKIKFDIPSSITRETQLVKIIVYDALGKEVTALVNQKLSPGSYEVDFNAANLPSGVYYYKLETGLHSIVKKMLFLK
ncbi:MAG: T9SS type A sorting domain-containing protein [Bacteroidota bacterium]|nr:T9SS type A sorting domain-containing protein [Bacteroidota bacterium]